MGSCHGQGGGHSRPNNGQGRRQRKTIGDTGITAGQGNGRADDGEGWGKGKSEGTSNGGSVDGKCQGEAEDGEDWCVKELRAGQGKAGQGRQCKAMQGREEHRAGWDRIG